MYIKFTSFFFVLWSSFFVFPFTSFLLRSSFFGLQSFLLRWSIRFLAKSSWWIWSIWSCRLLQLLDVICNEAVASFGIIGHSHHKKKNEQNSLWRQGRSSPLFLLNSITCGTFAAKFSRQNIFRVIHHRKYRLIIRSANHKIIGA